jgi:ribosome-associated protein
MNKREEVEQWVKKNIDMRFSRSDGPGGQNVNKRSTKVTAWVLVSSMEFLTLEEQSRLKKKLSGRLNSEGALVIRVRETRSQAQNRTLAVERATATILDALKKEKRRKVMRIPRTAKEKRLEGKRLQSEKKKLRGGVSNNGHGEE